MNITLSVSNDDDDMNDGVGGAYTTFCTSLYYIEIVIVVWCGSVKNTRVVWGGK